MGNSRGVIDFDAATQEPNDLTFFLPEYDGGNHLYPNAAGYARELPSALAFRLGEKESKQILKAHKRIQDGLIDLHETLHATVPLRKQAQRLHEI